MLKPISLCLIKKKKIVAVSLQLNMTKTLHQTCISASDTDLKKLPQQGWQVKKWDLKQQKGLLQKHYHWFLKTWEQLENDYERCTASAYFILHQEGGIFLQKGWKIQEDGFLNLIRLQPNDKVSLLYHESYYSPVFMMSKSKDPFWEEVFKALQQEQGWKTKVDHNFYAVGPGLLTDVVQTYGVSKVYPISSAYFNSSERYHSSRIFTQQKGYAPPKSNFEKLQRQMSDFSDTSGWVLVAMVILFALTTVFFFFLWMMGSCRHHHQKDDTNTMDIKEPDLDNPSDQEKGDLIDQRFRPKGLSRFIA